MASLTSSTLYGSPISLSIQSSGSPASSSSRSYHPSLQVLCQQSASDIPEQRTNKVPRRSIAVATVLAALMESYSLQEAHAAKRKTVEATEKKPQEDKSLSAYDAKLLATYRRKEAMKEAMAKQREKAKPIRKPAAVEVAKSEPEVATKAEPETPAASVAASASEAMKKAVETVLPSSE